MNLNNPVERARLDALTRRIQGLSMDRWANYLASGLANTRSAIDPRMLQNVAPRNYRPGIPLGSLAPYLKGMFI